MKFKKFHEISWNFMKIMKFIEILDFCESGGSKTLIFLRNYWCFCNVMNLMKFHFSLKNNILMRFHFSTFLKNFNENALFLKKRAHGVQDPPKCIVIHWFKQHSRQPAARVQKTWFFRKSGKLFARSSWRNWNFMKLMISSRISWFSTCQNIKYFLGNTWPKAKFRCFPGAVPGILAKCRGF